MAGVGVGAAQGDESADERRAADQPARLDRVEREGAGEAASVETEGDDDAASGGELVPPAFGQVPGPCRDHDPVVGRPARVARRTIPMDDIDALVAGCGQRGARARGEVLVDLDGGHLAGRAGELGEERGVDAGGGADLQDAVAGLDVGLFEHGGDEAGLRGRGQRGAIGGAAGDDNLWGVGGFQVDFGQEQVSRDRAERGFDLGGSECAPAADVGDQVVAELLGGSAGHRGHRSSGVGSRSSKMMLAAVWASCAWSEAGMPRRFQANRMWWARTARRPRVS